MSPSSTASSTSPCSNGHKCPCADSSSPASSVKTVDTISGLSPANGTGSLTPSTGPVCGPVLSGAFKPCCAGTNKFVTRDVDYIMCEVGEGQDKEGVTDGPAALKRGGLEAVIEAAGYSVTCLGVVNDGPGSFELLDEDVEYQSHDGIVVKKVPRGQSTFPQPEGYYNDKEIRAAEYVGNASFKLFRKVASAALRKHFVLNIGGDHSTGFGSLAGMLYAHPDLVVIWIDAHADINTPEMSPSGNYHGMPVGHMLGLFSKKAPGFDWTSKYIKAPLQQESLAYIGLRDLDDPEKKFLAQSNINVFTMQHIDKYGIARVIEKTLAVLDPTQSRPIHISLDIDSCDPSVAPGTGTRALGGLSYREIHYILETVAATNRLVSMDLVEINPILDVPQAPGMHGDLPALKDKTIITQTVKLGLECVNSALGGVIL